MNCEKVQGLISFYIENELNEEESNDLAMHLECCEACSAEYVLMKNIMTELSQIQDEDLPESFSDKIHEKLVLETNKEKVKFFKLSNYIKLVASVAACIMVVVFYRDYQDFFVVRKSQSMEQNISGDINTKMIDVESLNKKELKASDTIEKDRKNEASLESAKPTAPIVADGFGGVNYDVSKKDINSEVKVLYDNAPALALDTREIKPPVEDKKSIEKTSKAPVLVESLNADVKATRSFAASDITPSTKSITPEKTQLLVLKAENPTVVYNEVQTYFKGLKILTINTDEQNMMINFQVEFKIYIEIEKYLQAKYPNDISIPTSVIQSEDNKLINLKISIIK